MRHANGDTTSLSFVVLVSNLLGWVNLHYWATILFLFI